MPANEQDRAELFLNLKTIQHFQTNSYEQKNSNGKIHHAINGKIHYFDWAIFHCFLYVHQRVYEPKIASAFSAKTSPCRMRFGIGSLDSASETSETSETWLSRSGVLQSSFGIQYTDARRWRVLYLGSSGELT